MENVFENLARLRITLSKTLNKLNNSIVNSITYYPFIVDALCVAQTFSDLILVWVEEQFLELKDIWSQCARHFGVDRWYRLVKFLLLLVPSTFQ